MSPKNCRYGGMATTKTFAEILRDKLGTHIQSASDGVANHSKTKDFPLVEETLTRLWTRTSYIRQEPSQARKKYSVWAYPPRPGGQNETIDRATPPPPTEISAAAHDLEGPTVSVADLSKEQQVVLDRMIGWGATGLTGDSFTQKALKRAYRRLAKRFHPDGRGPEASALNFRRLHDGYLLLLQAFDKTEKQAA